MPIGLTAQGDLSNKVGADAGHQDFAITGGIKPNNDISEAEIAASGLHRPNP
jgi:hypothetical protein